MKGISSKSPVMAPWWNLAQDSCETCETQDANANSSDPCPLLGSFAVGGNAREHDNSIQRAPYMQAFNLSCWNSRSLWANNDCQTIDFAVSLARGHDVTILTETRENPERKAYLLKKLPPDLILFSSGIDQFKGGVAVMANRQFLQRFEREPTWTVLVQGRLARLELESAKGTLHIYAVYLDPESAAERDRQLLKLAESYDGKVHNIVIGDFNFVTSDSDRICKADAAAASNSMDKRNTKTWNEVNNSLGLKEFFQEGFTCENSFGWSRIDRTQTCTSQT